MRIDEYQTVEGKCPFKIWFDNLDTQTARIINRVLARIEDGNTSNIKGVGDGVFERVIDHGPGYRIYFGKEGAELIVLLGGGSKKWQPKDIKQAKLLWKEYKHNKKPKEKIWH
jgi:putative addiction module killer protein